MKTLDQILKYKSGDICSFLDGRDITRLAQFVPVVDWPKIGVSLKEGVDPASVPAPKPLTREAVLENLKGDLEFAFEKALNQRGLSSSMMFEVIKMWMWVLDDDLADFPDSDYAQYGLPLYKAVAVKYGLPNPIGNDRGNERKYASG